MYVEIHSDYIYFIHDLPKKRDSVPISFENFRELVVCKKNVTVSSFTL